MCRCNFATSLRARFLFEDPLHFLDSLRCLDFNSRSLCLKCLGFSTLVPLSVTTKSVSPTSIPTISDSANTLRWIQSGNSQRTTAIQYSPSCLIVIDFALPCNFRYCFHLIQPAIFGNLIPLLLILKN